MVSIVVLGMVTCNLYKGISSLLTIGTSTIKKKKENQKINKIIEIESSTFLVEKHRGNAFNWLGVQVLGVARVSPHVLLVVGGAASSEAMDFPDECTMARIPTNHE